MKVHDWYWKEIKNCIEYIDAEAYRGTSYKDINLGLQQKLNNRLRVVRDTFYVCMPYSLSRYIKRRMYTARYMEWQKNPIKLTARTKFYGVKKFAPKFTEEFGLEITEGLEEHDLQPKLNVEEIRAMHESLEQMPVVENYKMSGSNVIVEANEKEILKQMLRFKSYFLPENMESEFGALDREAKMLFLIMMTSVIYNKGKAVRVPLHGLSAELNTAKFYDFRDCYFLNNGYLIFVPKVSTGYYCVFLRCCDELLPYIKAVIPEGIVSEGLNKVIKAISEASTLEEVSEATGISDPRPVIWDYLRLGYLRLKDEFADNLYS